MSISIETCSKSICGCRKSATVTANGVEDGALCAHNEANDNNEDAHNDGDDDYDDNDNDVDNGVKYHNLINRIKNESAWYNFQFKCSFYMIKKECGGFKFLIISKCFNSLNMIFYPDLL